MTTDHVIVDRIRVDTVYCTIIRTINFSRLRYAAVLIAITAVYTIVGKGSLMLAYQFPSASPVWPPTGIAIAIFLLLGHRYWPAILLGAFLVNVTTAGSIATSVVIAAGNTLEGLTAVYLTRRFAGGVRAFERVEGVLLYALSTGAAVGVSATVGVSALILGNYASLQGAGVMWFTWWLGDAVGALTIAPLIILWIMNWRPWTRRWQAIEMAGLFTALLAISTSFFGSFFPGTTHYPLAFFCLLPIFWAAIRFGPREAITVICLIAGIAVTGTVFGNGLFAVASPNTSLLLLQLFVGVASLTGMILAAAMVERRAMEGVLQQKVHERSRELEAALERNLSNLQRLRATIFNLPMAALLMDEHKTILELNEAYCRMFNIGLPPQEAKLDNDELMRRFSQALLYPDMHLRKVLRAVEKRESVLEEEILLKDGRIIVRDLVSIHEDGQFHGQLFLYRDVTRERRTDRAKSEFMSLASHQLRTPLTAIRWSLSRLRRALPPEATIARQLLEEGQKATLRMSETIQTMLQISRIEADKTTTHTMLCNLADLFQEKKSLFREQYEQKNQTLSMSCPPGLSVYTDPTFLKEILRNLLQNAVKYTPGDGQIFLRAREENGRVIIEVEDTGCGIPAHQQKNIFQKFFRGDNVADIDTSGTGLGLYLVALLTDMLRGTIAMYSEEGKGTIFTLSLPHGVQTDVTRGPAQTAAIVSSRSGASLSA